MMQEAEKEISRIVSIFKKDQSADGSWDYAFETGIKTDAFMIVLLSNLNMKDEKLIRSVSERIVSKQTQNGSWKLFEDQDDGDLSATIEAYYALLYAGFYKKNHPRMEAARIFILERGGINKAGLFTKILLAITGQYQWPALFPLPIEAILLPSHFPVNFYNFSIYGRANMVPILILGNKKFQMKNADAPNLSELLAGDRSTLWDPDGLYRSEEWRGIFSTISHGVKSLIGIPSQLKAIAYHKAEQYMLQRIEPDGTFYSYFSATFLMIYALLSMGYSKDHPFIDHAVRGLKSMACSIDGKIHMQYTTAHVWNTSLISYALQESGLTENSEVIQRANNFLLTKQHVKYGDWRVHNQDSEPGGWGFSNINTINPDVDDTTASLRAISVQLAGSPVYASAWKRGTRWTLSMQNDDGGWPAFEKNVDSGLVHLLPIDGAEYILSDASSADLTGRTLEFLGSGTNLSKQDEVIKKGIRWLIADQKKDGSWYGRWGICYIYGTWAALTGLASCQRIEEAAVQKGARWLKSIQNEDGGWGESCKSDMQKKYVPLGRSTVTQTGWAVDALISISEKSSAEIERGIQYLIQHAGRPVGWTGNYPKGQGMAGNFYIHYHSYDLIFPLLALSHYRKKFLSSLL
ncbi:squalene--hopene cyclase [Metabacillus sp. RGM 3146]|uniref:squalene--hopene cyclase n=1 Tax=Metabacillus sp. RGM 3146 TaxID=3401092 RepID=UPI003B9D2B7E